MINKIIVAVLLVAAMGISWFIFNPGQTFDYVVVVDREVAAIEAELAEIDAAVAAGTLTEEQANEAKASILLRLDTINKSVVSAESGKLTQTQKDQLAAGLQKLADTLVTYKDTLATVDEVAVDAEVKRKLNTNAGRSSNGDKNLGTVIVETIEAVEDIAEEAIDDYEPIVIDEEIIAEIEASEEATQDEATEETGTEGETVESTEETETSETPVEETSLEIEAESENEIETN